MYDTRQEHLTAQLNGQKLEKTLQKLRHELAKSRAMNDLLQNEVCGLSAYLTVPYCGGHHSSSHKVGRKTCEFVLFSNVSCGERSLLVQSARLVFPYVLLGCGEIF